MRAPSGQVSAHQLFSGTRPVLPPPRTATWVPCSSVAWTTAATTSRLPGALQVHDIEDLVKAGKAAKCCPYFAARDMATTAELVFTPYNYLVDPSIREGGCHVPHTT